MTALEALQAAGYRERGDTMLDRDTQPTIVIYRRWKAQPKTIIALFPGLAYNYNGLIESYEHIGQHGGADYAAVISRTWAVNADEPDVQDLHGELTGIGYNLIIRKRRPTTA